MSRVNRPDTLATELREIRRRLRLLEGSGARATMAFTAAAAPPLPPVPLSPARPADWPATESADWESLLRTPAVSGRVQLILELVSDAETAGEARILVADEPAVGELTVTADMTRHVVEVAVTGEIVVQARRITGRGGVRVSAWIG